MRRGEEVLVFEGFDSLKDDGRFYRLLGGGIERAADAVVRELREETGSDAVVRGLLGVLENVFLFEREPGHEIAFVFEAELADPRVYELDAFEIVEVAGGEEVRVPARWVDPRDLDAPLYPDGVLDLIT